MTTDTRNLDNFTRSVNALAGIYYRMDKGLLTGRNSNATEDSMKWHMDKAREAMKSALDNEDDPLWAKLEGSPKFAAKWDRLERRYYGVRV